MSQPVQPNNTSSSLTMPIAVCSESCVLGTAQAEACGSAQYGSAHLYWNWYKAYRYWCVYKKVQPKPEQRELLLKVARGIGCSNHVNLEIYLVSINSTDLIQRTHHRWHNQQKSQNE